MSKRDTSNGQPAPRVGKAQQAQHAFVRLLEESSQRGFYGAVSLTLNVQDGFIQHVRVATDRLLK